MRTGPQDRRKPKETVTLVSLQIKWTIYNLMALIDMVLINNMFFLKICCYYFLIGKADIQRGETERKIFRPMIHSPSEPNG